MNKKSIWFVSLLAAFILIMPAFSQPGGQAGPVGPNGNNQGFDSNPGGFDDHPTGFSGEPMGLNDPRAGFDGHKPKLNKSAPKIEPDINGMPQADENLADKPPADPGKNHPEDDGKEPIDPMIDDGHEPRPLPPMESMMGPQKPPRNTHHIEDMMDWEHFPPMKPMV